MTAKHLLSYNAALFTRAALTVVCFFTLALPVQAEKTRYVSPKGNDAWSGTLQAVNKAKTDGPLRTLAGARDRLRELKAAPGLTEPVTVLVAPGRYELTEPLILTPQDSGSETCPITYRAQGDARPVITGGRVITGFTEGPDGLWQAQIPQVAAGQWYFEQLFVDGRRAVRARTPNEFYYYMLETAEVPSDAQGQQGVFRRTTKVPPHILNALHGLDQAQLQDVVLTAFHKWCISKRYLNSIDPAKKQIITIGQKLPGYSGWPANTRFILENLRAALDIPGEWFLSRDGMLYYKPLPDQDMNRADVKAPLAKHLLLFQGDPQKQEWVEHIRIEGLTFHHAAWSLERNGYAPYQAAYAIPAAIMLDGARHVTIENCEIAHIGNYALWFRQGCRDATLRHCYLHDLGAGGVRIGEGAIRPDEPSRTHHITIDNNIIRAAGRIYTDAVGVWVGQSSDNQITHNDISDLYYTGLSIGWRWGYDQSLCKRNLISFNHVHHIGQGVLSDMGGIYTLGPSEGVVVSNNVFHDIYSYAYGGWGLYTDEGSTGILMENNLVYNTRTGGFHQHYGKENVVRNNIFAFADLYQVQCTRVEPHLSFSFMHNIVYYTDGQLLNGSWPDVNIEMDHNCYFRTDNQPLDFAGLDFAAWQQVGHDQHSILADPRFVDPANFDFGLREDSPARQIGFEPFDTTSAGVYGQLTWKNLAQQYDYPPVKYPPPPDQN